MIATYAGKCCKCNQVIHKGDQIKHLGPRKNAHLGCIIGERRDREQMKEDGVDPKTYDKEIVDPIHQWPSWDTYLDQIDRLGKPREGMSSGRTTGSDFYGNTTLKDGIDFARTGWTEGIARVKKVSAPMIDKVGHRIERQDIFYNEEPGQVDIGRYLDGEPECCMQLVDSLVSGPGKFVNILFNATACWFVKEETINNRGASALALIELLEYAGCRVQLTLVYFIRANSGSSVLDHRIILKPYSQPLDWNRISFTALHPASLRRLEFRLMESMTPALQSAFTIPGAYGNVQSMPSDMRKDFDVYFEQLDSSNQDRFSSIEATTEHLIIELKEQGVTLN